jgi:hypothetical protein
MMVMSMVKEFISILRKNKQNIPGMPEDFNPGNRSFPEADKWNLSTFVIQQLIPVVGVHPFPLDELLLVCSTVTFFRPDAIIEWGTNIGSSARVFYEIVNHLKLPTSIHSIDLSEDQSHVENLQDPSLRGRLVRGLNVQLHLGDGLDTAHSVINAGNIRRPLFFLDGDHSYESVKRELYGIRSIASHAVILVHDTFYQGDESSYNCGPYLALKAFTDEYQLPVHNTLLGLPGMSLTYWGNYADVNAKTVEESC